MRMRKMMVRNWKTFQPIQNQPQILKGQPKMMTMMRNLQKSNGPEEIIFF
jgi:hypothetical protein